MDNIITYVISAWKWLRHNIFSIVVIALLITLVIFFVISPVINWLSYGGWENELRMYIRIAILLFIVNTFAVLRLYNSIVANTRFLIKTREALMKINKSIPSFERRIQSLIHSIGSLTSRMKDAHRER